MVPGGSHHLHRPSGDVLIVPARVGVWDRLGHVRYYVNGQLISQQDSTAAGTAAQPTATMSFLKGLGSCLRLTVYNGALTPDEVASLGGFEMVPPVPATLILVR